jgi:predicted RNA methylase
MRQNHLPHLPHLSDVERMKNVSIDHAAKIMAVSSATIRNWAKAGHIKPVSTRPLLFSEESVLSLKSQIGLGTFGRLQTRANKAGAVSSFLPAEYTDNPHLISHIADLVSIIKDECLEIEAVIFVATLRLLEINGEVKKKCHSDPLSFESFHSWARQSVKLAIHEWRSSLHVSNNNLPYSDIYELINPHDGEDFLGLLYQSISIEGHKSEQGSYYTPSKLVDDALSHIDGSIKTFLDPCCGSGQYLLVAANKFKLAPENIYGFECSRVATNIARINLLMAYKHMEFSPNIFCMDSLAELATGEIFCETNHLIGKIDAIATNPPWGAYKNAASKASVSKKIKSGETFSMFLEKSIQLLRRGGQLSFILPESILKIKIHADIRELVLCETNISKIAILGRQFSGVFTPVIRLDLIKKSEIAGSLVLVEREGKSDYIAQDRFRKNEDFAFDISTKSHEEDLLSKLYSVEHLTLSNNAEWALGIVTGDNKKFVLDLHEQGAEAVFRGSDVNPYYLGEPRSFIHFTPSAFQQVAQERFFRSPEKLIYKFISKRLVFAYDDRQCLTLNSANILIPSIPGMSIKTVLAFLNSSVFQYIFKKKFATHKVLRGDLEKLPFPFIDPKMQSTIERLVDSAAGNRSAPEMLDELIFSAFGLSENEISVIKQMEK